MSDFSYGYTNTLPPGLQTRNIQIDAYTPHPTKQDISLGILRRFFARPVAHGQTGEIVEIDQSTFNRLQSNSFYLVVEVPWRITGPIEDTAGGPYVQRVHTGVRTANRLALDLAEEQLPGIRYHLPNVLHLYQG